jgi:Ca2+-binding RTX toxin-like protein
VRFDRLDPAPFSLDIGTTENLVLNANGGNDTFAATGNLAELIQITVDGGDGNDFIDGQQGNDQVFLGADDDIFQWDPGDGNDVVEGQAGTDTLLFNGSAINDNIDISANGARVRFFRSIGTVSRIEHAKQCCTGFPLLHPWWGKVGMGGTRGRGKNCYPGTYQSFDKARGERV